MGHQQTFAVMEPDRRAKRQIEMNTKKIKRASQLPGKRGRDQRPNEPLFPEALPAAEVAAWVFVRAVDKQASSSREARPIWSRCWNISRPTKDHSVNGK